MMLHWLFSYGRRDVAGQVQVSLLSSHADCAVIVLCAAAG
jgi:hypothetical protein